MSTPSPRRLSRLALLVPLLAGCAHRSGSDPGESAGPSPEEPAVTAEDLERSPGRPIEEVLQARVPGAQIVRTPDGGIAVRIRGATSIHGSTEPLYVLDGMPIEAGPGGSLTGVNPYDIESIRVLTSAADTAMYGVRGANGVVLITTKRPKQ